MYKGRFSSPGTRVAIKKIQDSSLERMIPPFHRGAHVDSEPLEFLDAPKFIRGSRSEVQYRPFPFPHRTGFRRKPSTMRFRCLLQRGSGSDSESTGQPFPSGPRTVSVSPGRFSDSICVPVPTMRTSISSPSPNRPVESAFPPVLRNMAKGRGSIGGRPVSLVDHIKLPGHGFPGYPFRFQAHPKHVRTDLAVICDPSPISAHPTDPSP